MGKRTLPPDGMSGEENRIDEGACAHEKHTYPADGEKADLREKYRLPADIEKESMRIIANELSERGITLPREVDAVVRRVIHATADFDYAENLIFACGGAGAGAEACLRAVPIVTDTNMTLSGISRPAMSRLGMTAHCFMSEPEIARIAREMGTTRAAASQMYAARRCPGAILSVGNAPTALFEIARQIRRGLRPALVIGVPVGFVNVIESKEEILRVSEEFGIPAIVARGRKGGSTVACAILNALLYEAAGLLDPSSRS